MNPYQSDPAHIPVNDAYADVPSYGRYQPASTDFRIDRQHIHSHSETAQAYWKSVISLCDESNRIYPADEGGRDVFALGTVIIKSSHLHPPTAAGASVIDYSFADANEIQAIAACKDRLKGVRLPEFYFVGEIDGRQTSIQERLPGVCLNIASPYLSAAQKDSFKAQVRDLIRLMRTIEPVGGNRDHGHVVQDPHIRTNGRLNALEGEILFDKDDSDGDFGLMHNDLTPSNIIVDDDSVTGLIDWEMAGFLGLATAAEIHRKVRTPQREHFARANLSEERLRDIMWWNDLYDGLL